MARGPLVDNTLHTSACGINYELEGGWMIFHYAIV